MGAWGPKTFEDDTAVDWIAELIDAEDGRDVLLDALQLPLGMIEADQGAACIASAETVVAILDDPRPGMPDDLEDWVDENECDDISDLPEIAIPALQRVLGEESELARLWQEEDNAYGEDGYEEWKRNVEELIVVLERIVEA